MAKMKRHYVATIEEIDIGKTSLKRNDQCQKCGHTRHSFNLSIGRVQPQDVGKRVYEVGGILQVENDEQMNRRGYHHGSGKMGR